MKPKAKFKVGDKARALVSMEDMYTQGEVYKITSVSLEKNVWVDSKWHEWIGFVCPKYIGNLNISTGIETNWPASQFELVSERSEYICRAPKNKPGEVKNGN